MTTPAVVGPPESNLHALTPRASVDDMNKVLTQLARTSPEPRTLSIGGQRRMSTSPLRATVATPHHASVACESFVPAARETWFRAATAQSRMAPLPAPLPLNAAPGHGSGNMHAVGTARAGGWKRELFESAGAPGATSQPESKAALICTRQMLRSANELGPARFRNAANRSSIVAHWHPVVEIFVLTTRP
jgi:hypothetical protein